MMTGVRKLLPIQLLAHFICLVALLGYCQDEPPGSRKPGDIKVARAVLERISRQGADQILKELDSLMQLFDEPNPAVAALIITHPQEVVYELVPLFLIRIGRFEEFRKSLLELTESDDEQTLKGLRSWLPMIVEGYPEDITDPELVLRTDEEYLLRYLKAGKTLPKCYVDSLYLGSPGLALGAMFYAHHLAKGMKHEQIMDCYRDVRWVIHLVEVAKWRQEHGYLTPREIREVQRKLKWLWVNHPHWWARRYVLEVTKGFRGEIFRYEGLLKDLEKEKHPYVRERYEALKEHFRRQ